jgi:RHS repeat-associated protein
MCDTLGDTLKTWIFTYDGDGQKVKQGYTEGTSTLTTYYYAEGSYEVQADGTTETVRRYYSIAGMTVAMRDGTSIRYFLTDHLGLRTLHTRAQREVQVVGVTDASGVLLAETRYLPFGEVRLSVGSIAQTDFGYTFQRNNSYIKLLDYRFRSYSPELGRFVSPDSIVPDFSNPQSLNRYSYVINRPINFNDPTGHKACDGAGISGDDCEISKTDIISSIYYSYHWTLSGDWTKKELFLLLDTGIAIENKVSTLTSGNGRGWMILNLGGTSLHHNNLAQAIVIGTLNMVNTNETAGVVPGIGNGQNIFLDNSGLNKGTIVHELGHVLDNNTGSKKCAATWCGGGVADALTRFVGGTPVGVRWTNSSDSIPDNAKWLPRAGIGYGNNSTADYFAHAFAYLVVDPSSLPNASINKWMEATITMQDN